MSAINHEAAAVEALESIPHDVSPELAVQVAQAAATLALVAEVRALREGLVVDGAVAAAAWDEGALWAAVECGAIPHERVRWLAPGDNPYRGAGDASVGREARDG